MSLTGIVMPLWKFSRNQHDDAPHGARGVVIGWHASQKMKLFDSFEVFGVVVQVILDEGSDEKVAMIVAGLTA